MSSPKHLADFWKHLARALGVKHHMSTAYHPQTDGQTERTNKTIEEVLRNYVESSVQRNWDLWLPLAQFAINNSWQESIQTTPFVLNTGAHPMVPSQLGLPVDSPAATDFAQRLTEVVNRARASMSNAQQRQTKNANRHRRPKSFQVNDLVMFHSGHFTFAQSGARKLMPKYLGPFRVTEVKSSGAVKLDLPNYGNWQRIHPVVNVEYVVPYHKRPGTQETWQPPALVFNNDGSPEFEVEAIIDHRAQALNKRKRKRQHGCTMQITHYLVRWKGWTVEHDTWEPVVHLANASLIVQAYRDAHGLDALTYC
jgi:transposase InsO family protein